MQGIAQDGDVIRILGGVFLADLQAKVFRCEGGMGQLRLQKIGEGIVEHTGYGQIEAAVLDPRLQKLVLGEPVQSLANHLPVQALGQVKTFRDRQELVRLELALTLPECRDAAQDLDMVAPGGAGDGLQRLVLKEQPVVIERLPDLVEPFGNQVLVHARGDGPGGVNPVSSGSLGGMAKVSRLGQKLFRVAGILVLHDQQATAGRRLELCSLPLENETVHQF